MMEPVTKRPKALTEKQFSYCAGCSHGTLHRVIAEIIDDLNIREKVVWVGSIGCSVFSPDFFNTDAILVSHGRAPATATGLCALRLTHPDAAIITYQGDGDLGSIGFNELVHMARRGELVTVIFVNNGVYGMTGGQAAPTTLPGQKTTTTRLGLDTAVHGYPLKVCENLATIDTPGFVSRVSLKDAAHVRRTKNTIREALKTQMDGRGFSLVEILSACPTNWHLKPTECKKHLEEMEKVFPLGTFKTPPKDMPKASGTAKPLSVFMKNVRDFLGELEKQHGIDSAKNTVALEDEVIIAGFGGQGVLTAGENLCLAAMRLSLHATWIPSYGPEMRGGTSNCSVVLSATEIASPVIDYPTTLIAMNEASVNKFLPRVKKGGMAIINCSLVNEVPDRKDITIIYVDANNIAAQISKPKIAPVIASSVILGAYASIRGIPLEDLLETIRQSFKRKKPELCETNEKALALGYGVVSPTTR